MSELDAKPEAPAQMAVRLLAELRAAGAEHWDAPGLAAIDRLLALSEAAPLALATHLSERAYAHAQQLQRGFRETRERGAHALARLRAAEHPAQSLIAQALARGDTFLPRRLLRRAPQAGPRLRDTLRQNLSDQLDAQAQARGITSSGLIDSPSCEFVDSAPSSTHALAIAQALYHDAAAGASARMTLAKTTASVPPDAGRYHAVFIAARTLEEAARHPEYLKAMLGRLETLGVLWQHTTATPRAAKSKRSPRGGSGAEG
jgi:hypothetical protein